MSPSPKTQLHMLWGRLQKRPLHPLTQTHKNKTEFLIYTTLPFTYILHTHKKTQLVGGEIPINLTFSTESQLVFVVYKSNGLHMSTQPTPSLLPQQYIQKRLIYLDTGISFFLLLLLSSRCGILTVFFYLKGVSYLIAPCLI